MARTKRCKEVSVKQVNTTERPHVTVEVTLHLRYGLSGVAIGDVPELLEMFDADLSTFSHVLEVEASATIEAAERAACKLGGSPGHATLARHYDSRNVSLDGKGAKVYARIQITSICALPQSFLMELTENFLAGFWELANRRVKEAENGASPVTLANLAGAALANPGSALARIMHGDEPQLGSRA